jgi:hypothetical protein
MRAVLTGGSRLQEGGKKDKAAGKRQADRLVSPPLALWDGQKDPHLSDQFSPRMICPMKGTSLKNARRQSHPHRCNGNHPTNPREDQDLRNSDFSGDV